MRRPWTPEKVERYALKAFGELVKSRRPGDQGAYVARQTKRGGLILGLGMSEAEALTFASVAQTIANLDEDRLSVEHVSRDVVLSLRERLFGRGCSCGLCALEGLR